MEWVGCPAGPQIDVVFHPCSSPAAPHNPELDHYNQQWSTVQSDPSDFNTWTQLLTTSERLVSTIGESSSGRPEALWSAIWPDLAAFA